MKPFQLLIDYEVVEFVMRLSRKEQLTIRREMLRVRDFPRNFADYMEKDENERQYCVHIFGKYALKYWIDEADQHLKNHGNPLVRWWIVAPSPCAFS